MTTGNDKARSKKISSRLRRAERAGRAAPRTDGVDTADRRALLTLLRRTQSLLHQQIGLLDELEHDATDPEDLAALFRLDHLATRLRRYAEELAVLAGDEPLHASREPVHLRDVLRAGVSEIAEYRRVEIVPAPGLAVVGSAVGDAAHLLAALLENATAVTPPEVPVRLTAWIAPGGVAVEVVDRGPGVPPEVLAALNARLAASEVDTPPPLTSDKARAAVGLLVAARLAARHGIRVELRRSATARGLSAVAVIPSALLVTAPAEPHARPLRPLASPAASAKPASAPAPAQRTPTPAAPASPTAAGGGLPLRSPVPDAAAPADEPDGAAGDLPRRERAQHLPAAALRAEASSGRLPAADGPYRQRSADERRRMLRAMQAETRRARAGGAATAAPATTPTAPAAATTTAATDPDQRSDPATAPGSLDPAVPATPTGTGTEQEKTN